jgi:hypothetical protein
MQTCGPLTAESFAIPKSEETGNGADLDDVALLPEACDAPPGPQAAGFLSRVAFLWVGPLLQRGRKRQLQQSDLFEVCHARGAVCAIPCWQLDAVCGRLAATACCVRRHKASP